MRRLAVVAGALMLGAHCAMAAAIHDTAIVLQGRQVGTVESIDLSSAADAAGRTDMIVTASFDDFEADLDRYLQGRGTFQNRCSRRIYWVGDTTVLETGASLRLSSEVRYEQWACSSLGNARLLSRTKSVHWSLDVPPAPLDEVAVNARLEDIVDFPDAVERTFGLRVREEIPIPLPPTCGKCDCAEVIELLQPAFEEVAFAERGSHMQVTMIISMRDPWEAMACLS